MIEFHNVHKSFGKLEVLKGIDFKIEKGQVVTLIGPSGSGKSTILRCINLLEKPDSGTVLIEGQDITEKKADIQRIRKDIGMVFQHFNLFPHMTVMENMIYAPVRVNGLSKEEAKKKAMELLALVGLTEKADAYPNKLSGGQKQRIAIARIFLRKPEILILDEATSALDNTSERYIQNEIEKLKEENKMTVISIAHRLTTLKNSDRILVMEHGEIVQTGKYQELIEKDGIFRQMYEGKLK